MGCCNGDCLGSVQLVQGPDGPAGTDGSNGAPGAPELLALNTTTDVVTIATSGSSTIDLTYLRPLIESSTVQRIQTQNIYGTYHVDATIPADTLVNNGEFVRINFVVLGETDESVAGNPLLGPFHDWKLSLSGTTIYDTAAYDGGTNNHRLFVSQGDRSNGIQITVDLIKSDTNQLTPVIRNCERAQGVISDRLITLSDTWESKGNNTPFQVLPSIAATLGGSLNLRLQTKSDNNSRQVSVEFHEVSKFIKSA